MHASVINKQLAAASANNIALSQSLAASGALTLNGSTVSGGVAVLDTQRRVIVTSAGNDSALTWTVIGTDDTGNVIKDQFAGGNVAAGQSNLDFKTVTSISGSVATAAAVTAGTNGVGSSPWKLFSDTINTPNLSGYLALISGTGTASWEYTYDPFLSSPTGVGPAIAFAPASPNPAALGVTNLTSVTSTKDGIINFTIHAYRLTINAGTGAWRLTARQAGLASP